MIIFYELVCIFFASGYTDVYPPSLLIWPVQMPSLMNLIFSNKQKITFLTHWALGTGQAGWGKIFHPDQNFVLQVTGAPFFPGLRGGTGFCRVGFPEDLLFICLANFLGRRYRPAFSPTNKNVFHF